MAARVLLGNSDGVVSDNMVAHILLGNLHGVAPDCIAARVLLGNPDGVAPDSNAHSVSLGGGVPTPYTRRRSLLRRADISPPEFCPVRHVRIL